MASKKTPAPRKQHKTPTKYTEERKQKIVEAIRAGNTKTTAFKLAGFNSDAVYEMLKLGRDFPDKYPQYVDLAEAVEEALAEYEASRVALISTAADTGSWQAAAWWLERRNPDDWGRHDRVKHEVNNRPTIQLNQVILENASARELSRNLLRQLASDRADVTLGPGHVLESPEDGEEGRDTLHTS